MSNVSAASASIADNETNSQGPQKDPVAFGAVRVKPFIGIGYSAVPTKMKNWGISCDDFMSEWSEAIWGKSGRDDLQVIKDMGIDTVRTYGLGSHLDHGRFLDHASEVGLKVIVGFPDYIFLGTGSDCGMRAKGLPADCVRQNGADCFHAVREHFSHMLRNGYTVRTEGNVVQYHPAISGITIANEIEYKLQANLKQEFGQDGLHAKVLASAFDGLLSAEADMGIVGPRPFVTATVSYARCPKCKSVNQGFPGLTAKTPFVPFVADQLLAFSKPQEFVAYDPRNNLQCAYTQRWVNSFNTPRPAAALCETEDRALQSYMNTPLADVPVYIGEFHGGNLDPNAFGQDIMKVKQMVLNKDAGKKGNCRKTSNPLVGFSIFEYQMSYWKGDDAEGGSALRYGLWGLGDDVVSETQASTDSAEYKQSDVYCLFPAVSHGLRAQNGQSTNADSVIKALGGHGPSKSILCQGG